MRETIEARLIQPGDCLYACYEDLKRSGPMGQDARWDWLEAAADLLAQVPDEEQRLAWAILLSEQVARPGLPWNLVARHLLMRAMTRQGARP